ncbi:hypothetical protein GH714_007929 [Hevea brasiliensis]|uniref:Uncharacterized protein n=1 Tax=Hevea brasiliensis TaxID=3981 RepID=A0A6A6KKR3_HEVBR|nr:hypothetical protein GH714_007929 [Hevea brasiliensis]
MAFVSMANNNASEQPSASLALTPNNHPQKDELLVSGDRNFAIHGSSSKHTEDGTDTECKRDHYSETNLNTMTINGIGTLFCRMLGDRVPARNSLPYLEKLRRDIETEEAKLSMLSPQVSYYELQCAILEKENNEMKEKVEVLENEKARKEDEFQALKEELEKLNQARN